MHIDSPARPLIDETNLKILEVLATDGRITMRELGDTVGRSEATVRDRVSNLENRGILTGYEAIIDWAHAGLPILAIIEAHCPPDRLDELCRELPNMANLAHGYVTTGKKNVLALARARDMRDLEQLLHKLSAMHLQDLEVRITMEKMPTRRPNVVTAMPAAGPGRVSSTVPSPAP